MSGLNPFRPRRPDDPPSHHHHHPPPSSRPAPSQSSTSVPSYPVFGVSRSSLSPNGVSPSLVSPPVPDTSETAGSVASDDQSLSDPFHQDSATDDENGAVDEVDVGPMHRSWTDPSRTSSRDDRRRQSEDAALSAAAASSPQSSMGMHNQSVPAHLDDYGRYRDSASVSANSSTPHDALRAGRDSAMNRSNTPPALPPSGTATRPVAGHPTMKPLANRHGNREKVPPPPPKSHHGKLIQPSSPVPSRTPSIKAANRFSFHGTPSEASISPKPPSSTADYFTGQTGSQPERATESLQRSQSQSKRPPTPPLSRRHSQMRRSKTTSSKPSSSRLSIPSSEAEPSESPPPSPSSWSINPSRLRDVPSEEASVSRPAGVASSIAEADPSTPPTIPPARSSSAKRMSQGNMMPPPPPPRRTRGSSGQSHDSTRRTSMREENPGDENVPFVPQPSNAHDILADLSRLQKEVDDLRGHYESRKVSQ
ncbi:hypothetical protein BDV59DRAFT_176155 [Aspergillus ambiguus]|uniref:uncharacterized protein n=1 Tax=Aspergillus ambiguus TaxID=176160 RepID=UPI003CCE239F